MRRQFLDNKDYTLKEFNEDEVTLEKVVHIVATKLELANRYAPIVMYDAPFDFYISSSDDGTILKFSAKELLESCNSQICDGVPYFLDIDDMMDEFAQCLGGDPLSLVAQELRQDDRILSCIRKF